MAQISLTDEEIQKIIQCLDAGVEVPEELLPKLSPGFFEKLRAAGKFDYKELDKYKIPTIEYAGKRPESVILAQAAITGGAAPLQVMRSFGKSTENGWRNMIVQGDNLQFLKTCYMNQDPLIKDKVKGKVKLIYIDPPFGTGDEYGSSGEEMSYSAKIMGSEFIEGLRERLIYLREILNVEGSFFIRIDYRFGYHIKVILDEVFGKNNFMNHIVINKSARPTEKINQYHSTHDFLLFYAKSERSLFQNYEIAREKPKWRPMHLPGIRWSPIPNQYLHLFSRHNLEEKNSKFVSRARFILGKELLPPEGRHWALGQEAIIEAENLGKIRWSKSGNPESVEDDKKKIGDNWTDIPGYSQTTGYPTENSEDLLERAIYSGSGVNDLVLDCFAGSGTTTAVAEKLGRRWIMCDFGKHAIYTMQKRLLNIADSKKLGPNAKNNGKYDHVPKPFDIISAGAYDFSKIMNLRENKDIYISFVLGLFSISREATDFSSKYKLPNIYAEKDGNPVEVYPIWEDEYLKDVRIDEDYLQGIIKASGGKLKGDYYIVSPETCTIIGDTTMKNAQKEEVQFHLLKFPYKVLEDVSRQFQIEEQPSSSADINKLISSSGFYFNEEVEIKVNREENGLRIEHFYTKILNAKKERFEGIDGLSMILIDSNYDGKIFNMSQTVYAKEIGEDRLVKVFGLSATSAIIAIDKHGNESKIIRT